MKKVVCSFLSVLFTLCAICSAFSETAKDPLEGLSLDELLEVRNRIEERIQEQQTIDGEFEILPGNYEIGTEIPEGSYIIKAIKIFGEEPYITVRNMKNKLVVFERFYSSNQKIKIDLADGSKMYLSPSCEYTIKKADPLF